MNIDVICIGKLKEKYWTEAVKEYEKRLSRFGKVNIWELPESRLPENASAAQEEAVKEAESNLEKVTIADEVTDVICEQCGRNMVVKYGPHGKFLACPGFPECRNTKPYLEKAGVACPVCGQEVVIRRTKTGRRYFGCENPECDFMSWQKPSATRCPRCGGYMVEKGTKLVCADKNCGYNSNK